MTVLYFGCWNAPGHFWALPNGAWPGDAIEQQIPFRENIDGGYAPRRWKPGHVLHAHLVADPRCCFVEEGKTRDERRDIERDTTERDQGEFLIHHARGYTLMSWWDRTQGDTRGACNSNLVAEGEHDSLQMYDLLLEHFPHVAANLVKAGVVLREATPP